MRDELDRLASENDPARRWYVLRLRGQLLKLMGLKAMGVKPSDPAPTAKPKRADIGDLIAQAEADSAGDTPEDAQ